MMFRQIVADIIRPLVSILPRGRHRVFRVFGVGGRDDTPWQRCHRPIRILWDRDIQAWVRCDLREWGGRWYYYHQQYYDHLLPMILYRYLAAGDTFIDIGANIGVHTLLAARLVGETGTVIAVEPHPATCSWLRGHLAINNYQQAQIFQVGLGAEAGYASLTMKDNHSGTASMREDINSPMATKVMVAVKTGDTLLTPLTTTGRVFVKIDVEGLELAVLRGSQGFLSERKPQWVYVEVTPAWLEQRGESAAELIELMSRLGYTAALPIFSYAALLWPHVDVQPLAAVPNEQQDILFTYTAATDTRKCIHK